MRTITLTVVAAALLLDDADDILIEWGGGKKNRLGKSPRDPDSGPNERANRVAGIRDRQDARQGQRETEAERDRKHADEAGRRLARCPQNAHQSEYDAGDAGEARPRRRVLGKVADERNRYHNCGEPDASDETLDRPAN